MSDTPKQFDKQAAWQKKRHELSWPEKIRMAERVRESTAHWTSAAKSGKAKRDRP